MMNGIWYWYNVQCDRSVDLYSVSIQLLNYNVKCYNVTITIQLYLIISIIQKYSTLVLVHYILNIK